MRDYSEEASAITSGGEEYVREINKLLREQETEFQALQAQLAKIMIRACQIGRGRMLADDASTIQRTFLEASEGDAPSIRRMERFEELANR